MLMNTEDIKKYLPHRYPFLLIDRVEKIINKNYLEAIKNVTINEFFFKGHFPSKAIMPGVLILESIAQSCALLTYKNNNNNRLLFLSKIINARFYENVIPGDILILKVKLLKKILLASKFDCKAYVKNNIICSTEMICIEEKK